MARPLPKCEPGTQYHSWTVLDGQSVREGKYSAFRCQCECGTIKLVRWDQLRFGHTKSCGCLATKKVIACADFWSKSTKLANGCWDWNQCKTEGYGIVTYLGRKWRAHRLAYLLANGEFDLSLNVLHKCDNPHCVNPDHLFLGTTQDNNKDCYDKNRHTKGEMRNFKLLEKHVVAIRELREKHSIPIKELARIFDVSASMVEKIVYRKEWKHI